MLFDVTSKFLFSFKTNEQTKQEETQKQKQCMYNIWPSVSQVQLK